ncbi:MAG: hypothetical protein E7612_08670 [Ruminococcaceae bacterium]|nr:hypothetical protein [Oscillospiraceae bacterium]
MPILTESLEIIMMLCFGSSWPFNVVKSYKARTTKGKSLVFLCLVIVGYTAGIINKVITFDPTMFIKWLSLSVYCLNVIMVTIDLLLYIRNYRLDKLAALEKEN